jgi:sporulation protein YlmC with PRC-barrel domain
MTRTPDGATGPSTGPEVLRLTDVVGLRAVATDGTEVGHVRDVRLHRASLVVAGLVLGGRRREVRWGYDRHPEQGPWLLARIARLLHPHTGYVPWHDVEAIDLERRTVRVRITTDTPIPDRSAPRGGSS